MPIVLVLEWHKRGSADGFSSISLVMPTLQMACWYKYGLITNDSFNIYLNFIQLCISAVFLLSFAYYQPKRTFLVLQLSILGATLYLLFSFVNLFEGNERVEKMSAMAATAQLLGLIGPVNDLKRAINFGHTEYIPASIQYALLLLNIKWLIYAFYVANHYMLLATWAGFVINVLTIGLYFIYPPLTWKVPIIGTGPQEKKIE
uniref:Sugar transporter SWEET1 n=1 Tax=Acrobeloides nanus TaxID=290746 RepID=A0A914DP25_9BILA